MEKCVGEMEEGIAEVHETVLGAEFEVADAAGGGAIFG